MFIFLANWMTFPVSADTVHILQIYLTYVYWMRRYSCDTYIHSIKCVSYLGLLEQMEISSVPYSFYEVIDICMYSVCTNMIEFTQEEINPIIIVVLNRNTAL